MAYTNNELKRRYFKIEITNPDADAADNQAGFIDSMKFQDYTDFNRTAGTEAAYTAKALGYIRWCNLALALSQFGVFYSEVNELTGATSLLTPSKIIFTMGYEQAENMYLKVGNTEFVGIAALEKLIINVMTNDISSFATTYNPSLDSDTRGGKRLPSGGPLGFRDKFLTAEKICATATDAHNCITITELGKLTLKPVPSDATVTLTATGYTQIGNSITVPLNTIVNWSVSKTGYTTKTGSTKVTSTMDLSVVL